MENYGEILHDNLKKYFGFDSFKGNQEEIITNVLKGNDTLRPDANRWREIPLLPATGPDHGGNRHCYFTTHCPDEEPGGCHAELQPG